MCTQKHTCVRRTFCYRFSLSLTIFLARARRIMRIFGRVRFRRAPSADRERRTRRVTNRGRHRPTAAVERAKKYRIRIIIVSRRPGCKFLYGLTTLCSARTTQHGNLNRGSGDHGKRNTFGRG